MPTKAELYAQMAEKVTTQLTGGWQEWVGFLTTASRLYKIGRASCRERVSSPV